MIAITFLAAATLTNVGLQDGQALSVGPRHVASAPMPELPSREENLQKPKLKRHAAHSFVRRRNEARVSPILRVRAANRSAVIEPANSNYLGSTQVYPWTEGALYRLYTAPGRVSDVALQAGERLISVAAGDTVRWVIGDTESGTGSARRTHILVKPTSPSLRTNLIIATDRRVYHVDIESIEGAAMASVSWTYPDDPLLVVHPPAPAAHDAPAAAGVEVEALNFDYRIEGDAAPWRPLRAFDDGHQVFIEFPPSLGQGEAPPLFVLGEGGQPELVNYRVRGRYYVVDHLFGEAELRLGERRQKVVRIVREGRPS